MKADLHVHTVASDGTLTSYEIVQWAHKKNIKAIGITDHDTTEGIFNAIESAKEYDIIIVPGIEISCIYENEEIHILGYYIDYECKNILEITKILKESRLSRGEKIVKKLNELGLNLSIDDIHEIAGKGVIGRPHIARAMIEKNYVSTIEEAFEIYIGRSKPAYVERFRLSIEEGISLIHNAGGAAVIAHPGLINNEKATEEAIKLKVDGIEAIHSKHSVEETIKYSKLADKYNLIITGGSDFHDKYIDNIPVLGDYYVDINQVNLLNIKSKYYKKRRNSVL